MTKQNKMATMPIPELVFNISLPIMISMLVQSLYNIVDGIFVSRINESALTATSIAYSVQMLQIAVAVGTGVGVNAVISRYLGAKKFDLVNRSATTGFLLTFFSSMVFVIWGLFGTKAFISLFTSDPKVIVLGSQYLRICQIFCTGIFLGTFFQRLLQASGKTLFSMLAQMAGALVNIILDPILIFGLFHFPVLGIQGAAIATVIGQWVAAILGYILHKLQNKDIRFEIKGFKLDINIIKKIYKVGAPTIFVQATGSVMVAMMNMLLGSFTSLAVTFFGIYYKLQSFLFMPMNGLGQGTLSIIGYNYGAKNEQRMKQAVKVSLLAGCTIGLMGTVFFILFTNNLLHLFAASSTLMNIGVPALRIISLIFVFSSFTMITGYIISALGSGMVNMISTLLRQIVILLPVAYILAHAGGIGCVWFSFWVSEIITFIYALMQLKKHLKAVDDKLLKNNG